MSLSSDEVKRQEFVGDQQIRLAVLNTFPHSVQFADVQKLANWVITGEMKTPAVGAPHQYVAVLRGFKLETQAMYFDALHKAHAFCAAEQALNGKEWQIFSRPMPA